MVRAAHGYLFLLLVCVPFFVSLDTSSIWDSNEAFYVQTPREMVARSDWLVPYFNHEPRLNKPPLSYWLVAILYRALGVSVFWERLLMALLACLSVVGVYRLGVLLFSSGTALLGAGVFATSFRFLTISRRYLIEVLLLTCIIWSLYFLLRWVSGGKWVDALACGAILGLGFLTKGPVALILLIPVSFFLWRTRPVGLRPGWPMLAGVALCVCVSASWFVALAAEMGLQPLIDFFLRDNVGRFTSLDYGPQRGLGYYIPVFVGDFFPWSVVLLVSLPWWFAHKSHYSESDRRSLFLCALWICSWVAIFSLSRGKQEYYVLPAYPMASLWVAHHIRRIDALRWPGAFSGVLLTAVGCALPVLASILFGWSALWILIALPGPAFLLFAWVGRWRGAVLTLSLFYGLCFGLLSGPLEQLRPARALARRIQALEVSRPGPYRAGYLSLATPSLTFYLDRPILQLFSTEQAGRALDDDVRTYLLVPEADLEGLRTVYPRLHVLDSALRFSTSTPGLLRALGSGSFFTREAWVRAVLLVSNRPPQAAESSPVFGVSR